MCVIITSRYNLRDANLVHRRHWNTKLTANYSSHNLVINDQVNNFNLCVICIVLRHANLIHTYIGTSQKILSANQMTGFYKIGTLLVKG